MTEAWMVRGSERQEFLNGIKRMIMDEEEETHRRLEMQIPFTIAIVAHLGETYPVAIPFSVESRAQEFLEEKILPQIKVFARTAEEEIALIADLLEWEVGSIVNSFRSPLHAQEISEPERLFQGRSAMEEAAGAILEIPLMEFFSRDSLAELEGHTATINRVIRALEEEVSWRMRHTSPDRRPINTVGEFLEHCSLRQLNQMPWVGKKSVSLIVRRLGSSQLRLKET